ncbi:hypothetical protein ACFVT1_32715 [Streptomyces sp. NPDC057963]|uniref:hypothetical protein n=1 Tax=Streptomyces sp. NPDC057963 TaxID=3346290 RepID=UPI0036E85667
MALGRDLRRAGATAEGVASQFGTTPKVIQLSRRACGLKVRDFVGHLPHPLSVLGLRGFHGHRGLDGLRFLREEAWLPKGTDEVTI